MAEQVFKPGDTVPKSGLYVVAHAGHRTAHEATLFEGEQFPACSQCNQGVQFKLLRGATPIGNDADFGHRKARGHSRSK